MRYDEQSFINIVVDGKTTFYIALLSMSRSTVNKEENKWWYCIYRNGNYYGESNQYYKTKEITTKVVMQEMIEIIQKETQVCA